MKRFSERFLTASCVTKRFMSNYFQWRSHNICRAPDFYRQLLFFLCMYCVVKTSFLCWDKS